MLLQDKIPQREASCRWVLAKLSQGLIAADNASFDGRLVIWPRVTKDRHDLLSLTLIPEMFPKTVI